MDVIFDVDGTLMDITHRRHFVTQRPKDFDSFRAATTNDTPKKDIFAIALAMKAAGHRIIISSGRNMSQRATTLKQLMSQGLAFDAIYMRSDTDYRQDYVVKQGMLDKMRKELTDSIVSIAPIFGEKPFFMSDDFTIVDCCVFPILWRLPKMGIRLPNNKATKPLLSYRDRLFERESVMDSLSEKEKDMM